MNKIANIQPKREKSNSKKRDYRLIVDGKFNVKAIMQRAWVYVRNYGYSLKSALRTSWIDAHLKMDEYFAEQDMHQICCRGNLISKEESFPF